MAGRHIIPVGQRIPRLFDAVRRVRIAQGQEQTQRLIAIVLAEEVDGPVDHGPIAVEPGTVGRCLEPALEEAEVVVPAGIATPREVATVRPGLRRYSPALVIARMGSEVNVAVRLEAELTRHQVILATPPDEVPVVAQDLQQVRLAKAGIQHVIHRPMSPHMRVPTGHERAATRRADRRLNEGAPKGNRVGGDEPVDIGCLHCGMADVAQCIAAPLVGVEDDDMGSTRHGVLGSPESRSAHK